MLDYLLAMGLILLMLIAWILVQQAARNFAARHPQFGPAKEEGSGCGAGCSCSRGRCSKAKSDLSGQ
ncbi:MAG: hypothetical protein ACR2QG_04025 [Gammaproteobacteria bacterium]